MIQLFIIIVLLFRDGVQLVVGRRLGIVFESVTLGLGRVLTSISVAGVSLGIRMVPVPLLRVQLSDSQRSTVSRKTIFCLSGATTTFLVSLISFCVAKGFDGPITMCRAFGLLIGNILTIGVPEVGTPAIVTSTSWIWLGVIALILTLLHLIPLPMFDAGKWLMLLIGVPGKWQYRLAGVMGILCACALFVVRLHLIGGV